MPARSRAGVPGTETPRVKDGPKASVFGPKLSKKGQQRAVSAAARALDDFLEKHGADEATRDHHLKQFRALLRNLPSRSPAVAELCASQVMHGYLATYYHLLAQKEGPATTAGEKLARQAHSAAMHQQRFGLTARDFSLREAGYAIDGGDRSAPGGFGGVSMGDIDAALEAAHANMSDAHDELIARVERIANAAANPLFVEPPPPVEAPAAPAAIEPETPTPAAPTPRVRIAPPPIERDDDGDPHAQLRRATLATVADPAWRAREAELWNQRLLAIGSPAAVGAPKPPKPDFITIDEADARLARKDD